MDTSFCDSINNVKNMWRRMATLCATLCGELRAMPHVPADVIAFLEEQERSWHEAVGGGLVMAILPSQDIVDCWEKDHVFDLAIYIAPSKRTPAMIADIARMDPSYWRRI